jgi:hypothetical protein
MYAMYAMYATLHLSNAINATSHISHAANAIFDKREKIRQIVTLTMWTESQLTKVARNRFFFVAQPKSAVRKISILLTLSCRCSQKSFVIVVGLVNLLVKSACRKSHTVHL